LSIVLITKAAPEEEAVSDEVDDYLFQYKHTGASYGHDVLEFWKRNRDRWPKLLGVVRKILAQHATSAKPESDFSLAQNLMSDLRSHMNPQHCSDFLLIRANHEVIEKWYKEGEVVEVEDQGGVNEKSEERMV
jgi:iron-sulfur cluster repair protein YtfE (RIC family)